MTLHVKSHLNLSDMTRFCRKCKVIQIDPLWFLECLPAVYHRKQYKTLKTESNLDIGLVLSMHLHVNTYNLRGLDDHGHFKTIKYLHSLEKELTIKV